MVQKKYTTSLVTLQLAVASDAVASDAAARGRAVQVGERRAPAKALHIMNLRIARGETSLASGTV
jgi:hypothetical protein